MTTWQNNWRDWTHATYALLHSVRIVESIDFGNLTKLQRNIAEAQAHWPATELGFMSAAAKKKMADGDIKLRDDPERLASLLQRSVPQILLVTTVAYVEVVLCDELARCDPHSRRPGNLSKALTRLKEKLKQCGRFDKTRWAIEAMQEARILRNCIAHSSSVWSQEGVDEFSKIFPLASMKPTVGSRFVVGVDAIFAYRRAARTVLNEAARIK